MLVALALLLLTLSRTAPDDGALGVPMPQSRPHVPHRSHMPMDINPLHYR